MIVFISLDISRGHFMKVKVFYARSHKIFQGTATPRVASAKDPELDRVEEEEGGKDNDSGKIILTSLLPSLSPLLLASLSPPSGGGRWWER